VLCVCELCDGREGGNRTRGQGV